MDLITTNPYPQEEPVTVISPRRGSHKKAPETKEDNRLSVIQTILVMALIFLVTFAARFYVLQVVTVDGVSMLNTLTHGERVLVLMCGYWFDEPKRGDIVMCTYPKRDGSYIKRIIGLPGEMVMIRDSVVYIDGRPLPERYIGHPATEDFGPTAVPKDQYFVIGDNRPVSGDSRLSSVGALKREQIKGRASAVISPFDKFGALERR